MPSQVHLVCFEFLCRYTFFWKFRKMYTFYEFFEKVSSKKGYFCFEYWYLPLTCLHPNCSITSGGKTLDAKALLNMALNSLSSPPTPILLKSQSGLMMDCRCTLPLDLPLNMMLDPSAFSNTMVVLAKDMPLPT